MSDKQTKKVPPIFHSDIPDLLAILLVIPVIGILSGMLLPVINGVRHGQLVAPFWIALSTAVVGVVLLFWARLPLYREHKFFSFGSRSLPPKSVPIYRAAYALLIPSVLFLLLLALMVRGR
jgi:hypothetical protein